MWYVYFAPAKKKMGCIPNSVLYDFMNLTS